MSKSNMLIVTAIIQAVFVIMAFNWAIHKNVSMTIFFSTLAIIEEISAQHQQDRMMDGEI